MNPADAGEQTIFDAVRQMPDAQARAAYLDEACAGDQNLRGRIEKLLQAGQRADEFFAGDGRVLVGGLGMDAAMLLDTNAVPTQLSGWGEDAELPKKTRVATSTTE
jgi:hypothetical protein